MMSWLDQQIADAACAEGFADQANSPVRQFIERAGFFTDACQFVEGCQAVTQGALGRGSLKQLGAKPEVGQRDRADAGDWLEEVDVVLLTGRCLGPLQVQDAGQPIVNSQGQDGLRAYDNTSLGIRCQLGQPHAPVGLQLGDGRPVARRLWNVALDAPISAGRTKPDDGVNAGVRRINEDVAAAGCSGGRDDLLDRLLGQPCEIVRRRAKKRQFLQGPEFGSQAALMFGSFRQALAHSNVRVGDRDDPAYCFDVSLVRRTYDVLTREVAQKRSDNPVGLSNREDGERGDRAHEWV